MTDARTTFRIPAEKLVARCDPASLPFQTTADVEPLEGVLGQERAVRAIEFGLGVEGQGYNLYVSGPDGIGKSSLVEAFLRQKAMSMPAPPDWVYVHNFTDPDHPVGIALEAGRGREFAIEVKRAVESAIRVLRQTFESESYVHQRQELDQDLDRQRAEVLEALGKAAEATSVVLQFTPAGIVPVPAINGKAITPDQYQVLPPQSQERLREAMQRAGGLIQETMLTVRRLERAAREKVDQLDTQVAAFAIDHLLDPLWEGYGRHAEIAEFLKSARNDIIAQRDTFLRAPEAPPGAPAAIQQAQSSPLRRYEVNVVVTNDPAGGAPVINETHPTYYNLVGRIEYTGMFGTMVTDHMQVKPGALARANGGFLVLRLRDLFSGALSYDALKRALMCREIAIENIQESLGMVPTTGLRPEPIPLDTKVVIIGDPQMYSLLYRQDPDFRELFRVKAEFEPDFPRSADRIGGLVAFIRRQSDRRGLRAFSVAAVALLVEHSARLVEDQSRLSANLSDLLDVLIQADYWAGVAGETIVGPEHVERAIEEGVYRSSLLRDRIEQLIDEGSIFIDTTGARVGQVNALSIYDLGDTVFGRPSRITCTASAGRGTIVNVERETGMAGQIHNKGFLILRGYLAHRFGQEQAMAISASLTFEQLYGEIDGDSASSTELYAILSALSGVPLAQGIAVTGSVNQLGEVQPIGGATHKIEGFYEVCRARGLDGTQGVMIPKTNVKNVVLRPEVSQAVAEGRFHVWAVGTIEEGIEVLTGVAAGERDGDGRFAEGTVFARVEAQLATYAAALSRADGAAAEAVHIVSPEPRPATPPGVPPEPPPGPPIRT
ncbi:MAG: ATP-binding protein [Dehalococcoidia bacterium]|nr:ATP-binding protein [Dehalococcoidia bacterium]